MGNASIHFSIGQSLADEIEGAAGAAVARCRLGDGRLYCPSRQAGIQGWWSGGVRRIDPTSFGARSRRLCQYGFERPRCDGASS